jgi:hypothetical protein
MPTSVRRDERGRPYIVDMALAHREFTENSSRPTKRARLETTAPAVVEASPSTGPADAPQHEVTTLLDAQRRVAIERARSLKMANDVQQGLLIDANRAAMDAFEAARVIREALLNLPARLAPELAAETDSNRIFTRLDAELRQALELVSKELAS